MAAGKMTPFYIALGAAAVLGGVLIMRAARGPRTPTLTLTPGVPVAAGPRGVVFGSDSAPVELIEFGDFECGWCARYAVLQMPDIKQRLVPAGKLRVRFLHFPLEGHTRAPLAHLAAACANEQGRFWQMHDVLYENQDEWIRAGNPARTYEGYAERIGLDIPRYRSCVSEQRAWGQVLNDKSLGDSLGVGGTPTFFINGRLFDEDGGLTYDRLRVIVDSLAAASAPAAPATRR
jgi:protein-disulfide isomerase